MLRSPLTMPARRRQCHRHAEDERRSTAIPNARTRTVGVKSSRERVAATWSSRRGITRVPTTAVTRRAVTIAVSPSAVHSDDSPLPPKSQSRTSADGERVFDTSQPGDKRPAYAGRCYRPAPAGRRCWRRTTPCRTRFPPTNPTRTHGRGAPRAVATALCARRQARPRRTASNSSI